jgi:hypothetical protein
VAPGSSTTTALRRRRKSQHPRRASREQVRQYGRRRGNPTSPFLFIYFYEVGHGLTVALVQSRTWLVTGYTPLSTTYSQVFAHFFTLVNLAFIF